MEEQSERAESKVRLSLELNAEPVSTAVGVFIQYKGRQIVERKRYDAKTRHVVLKYLPPMRKIPFFGWHYYVKAWRMFQSETS